MTLLLTVASVPVTNVAITSVAISIEVISLSSGGFVIKRVVTCSPIDLSGEVGPAANKLTVNVNVYCSALLGDDAMLSGDLVTRSFFHMVYASLITAGASASEAESLCRYPLTLRYMCVLTGASSGLSDIFLPISSFQCRLYNGTASYLSVVIPSLEMSLPISHRSSGEIVVTCQWWVAGRAIVYEREIVRVLLHDIQVYNGCRSKSMVLSGYKTVTRTILKQCFVSGVVYLNTQSSGKTILRLANPDWYIEAGDTVIMSNGKTCDAHCVLMSVSPSRQSFEIQSA